MNANVRYLAIVSHTPHRLAGFYATHFGLRELGRSPEGDVSLTDGFYNMTFLLHRPGIIEAGGRRVGIAVDDVEELEDRLERHGAKLEPDEGGLHTGEFVVHDPNGLPVSVSTTNFGVPDGKSSLPALVHVAQCAPDGEKVAEFMTEVMGLRKKSLDHWGRSGHFVGDDTTNVAILASAGELRAYGRKPNLDRMYPGWNHFGFEAPSAEDIVAKLPAEAGATLRTDRPRPKGYYRIWDPDGNHFDLRSLPAWRGE